MKPGAAVSAAAAQAVAAWLGASPVLKLYAGTAPESPDSETAETLLCTLPLSASALGTVVRLAQTAPVAPVATGEAAWGRLIAQGGEPAFDFVVGTDITLSDTVLSPLMQVWSVSPLAVRYD